MIQYYYIIKYLNHLIVDAYQLFNDNMIKHDMYELNTEVILKKKEMKLLHGFGGMQNIYFTLK